MAKAYPYLIAAITLMTAVPLAAAAPFGDGNCEPPVTGGIIEQRNTSIGSLGQLSAYEYCYYDNDAPDGGVVGEGYYTITTVYNVVLVFGLQTGTVQVYTGEWHMDPSGPHGAPACGMYAGVWIEGSSVFGTRWLVLRALPCLNVNNPLVGEDAAAPILP